MQPKIKTELENATTVDQSLFVVFFPALCNCIDPFNTRQWHRR